MHAKTIEKLKNGESNELRINIITGSVMIRFRDGYEDELVNPPGIKVIVAPEQSKKDLLSGGVTSQIFYLLLLRPHNKYTLSSTYYGRKSNLPRKHIEKFLSQLLEAKLVKEIGYDPIFKETFNLTGKSKYVFTASFSTLLELFLADNNSISWEDYFLLSLLKNFDLSGLFFEFEQENVRNIRVNVLGLFKSKIYSLITYSLFLKYRYREFFGSLQKSTDEHFKEIMAKLGYLFDFVDPVAPLSYFMSILYKSLDPKVKLEVEIFLRKFYGKDFEPILNLVIFLFFLPEDYLESIFIRLFRL